MWDWCGYFLFAGYLLFSPAEIAGQALIEKVTKKSRLSKKSWKFEWLPKMKSVTTFVQSQAFVGLTNNLSFAKHW